MALARSRSAALRAVSALLVAALAPAWSSAQQSPSRSGRAPLVAPRRPTSYADRSALFDPDAGRIAGPSTRIAARSGSRAGYFPGQRAGQYTNRSIPATGKGAGRGGVGMSMGMGMGMGIDMGMGGGMR
jgi:hypothetical protein